MRSQAVQEKVPQRACHSRWIDRMPLLPQSRWINAASAWYGCGCHPTSSWHGYGPRRYPAGAWHGSRSQENHDCHPRLIAFRWGTRTPAWHGWRRASTPAQRWRSKTQENHVCPSGVPGTHNRASTTSPDGCSPTSLWRNEHQYGLAKGRIPAGWFFDLFYSRQQWSILANARG